MRFGLYRLFFAAALLLSSSVCHGQTTSTPTQQIDAPELSQFKQLVTAAGISDLFQGTGPFTAFAPTNAAFEKLGKDKMNKLFKPENKDTVADILLDLVVPGKYLAKNLKTMSIKTVGGANINIRVENGMITINNHAKVIKTDLVGPNGVIHEIDTFELPKSF